MADQLELHLVDITGSFYRRIGRKRIDISNQV